MPGWLSRPAACASFFETGYQRRLLVVLHKLLADDFERDGTADVQVVGLVDDPHRALAEPPWIEYLPMRSGRFIRIGERGRRGSQGRGRSGANTGLGFSSETNDLDTETFLQFLLKCRDPVFIRGVLRLKFHNFRLKFSIFRLQVFHIGTNFRLRRLEC